MGLDCVLPEADPRQGLECKDFVGSGAGGNNDVRREGHQVGVQNPEVPSAGN